MRKLETGITSGERRHKLQRLHLQAGFLLPHLPHPFFFLERLRWSRALTLGAAPERHCGVARQGAVLAVFRELLVPIPGAPALGHQHVVLPGELLRSLNYF